MAFQKLEYIIFRLQSFRKQNRSGSRVYPWNKKNVHTEMPTKAAFIKGDDSNASGNTLYQNIYHIKKIR